MNAQRRPYIERMLEAENLTDELQDREARRLLQWGIARLDGVLQNAGDAEDAGKRVNRLMAVIRKINHIAGGCAGRDARSLAEDLRRLRALCGQAFGLPPSPAKINSHQKAEELAAGLAGMQPGQALDLLIEFCAFQ